ncbi:molybdopterin molybdotransferase MoeA [Desulfovibrio sp.]|uniref:molybdopterin molybdotransferase MoeA n=1 Tax=Desulfovibrio sp. TaxID=885 RepID=UPI0025C0D4AF|nr:molybdopterin molybdotransferase MoeA [Desulfovibrio sp.]
MSHYFCLRETAELTAFIADFAALPAESVSVAAALGRVLAHDICSPLPCPAKSHSVRDGYAVLSADVAGASPQTPILLRLAGECHMGKECNAHLQAGEAWRVFTGGPLPHGADAVVMQEDAVPQQNPASAAHVAVCHSCPVGQHVLARGADMPQGAPLAKVGTKLGAHHIALLAQFFQQVPVHRRPVLGVLATGDEFCTSNTASAIAEGQTSTNALLLEALATTLGACCLHLGTVPDNIDAPKERLRSALPDGPTPCDVIVVIGGSSGGKRDFSAQVIAELPGCRLCGHDQRVSSGRPLTIARVGQTSIWGLPGHSLSLALAAQVFLAPLLQRLGGQQTAPEFMGSSPTVLARLGLALPAGGPAPTHYPVMLRREHGRLTAWPVTAGTGKTAVLRDMHGWITMPGSPNPHREGLPHGGLRRGAALRVRLFA